MENKKVLLVDDSAAIIKLLQAIIEGVEGFEVAGHARNGIEAIKLFTSLKPYVVFMDIVMPEMDGLQAVRSITNLDKDARIIVISSAGGVGDNVAEAMKVGAKNVISKPIDPQKVAEILKKI